MNCRKSFFTAMASLLAILIISAEATADSSFENVPSVFYQGKHLDLRPMPRVFGNRLFLESMELAQYGLGYAFMQGASIIIVNANHRISMRTGSRTMLVAILRPASSREQILPDPPISVSGQMYIPLRSVVEALGGSVEYHPADFRVVINSGAPTPAPLETITSTLSASYGEATRKVSVIVQSSITTSLEGKAPARTVSIPAIASQATATSDYAGLLATNSAEGGVLVADVATGRVRWRVSGQSLPVLAGSSSTFAALCSERPCASQRAELLHGVLLLRARDAGIARRVIAHDLRSGRVLWSHAGLDVGAFGTAVLLFRDNPKTNQGTLETFDLRSGKLRGSTSANFLSAAGGTLIDPSTLFVTGGAQGAISTTASAVLDWPSGSRIGWYKIDSGPLLYADQGRLALRVTSLGADAESYRPFVVSIVDARSGRILLPGDGKYVYAPDPHSVSIEHPHDYSRAEADQVFAGPRWTWMRLFGIWYRYRSDIDPRRDRPIRIDGLGDVVSVFDDEHVLARTSDGGLAVVHASADRVFLRPLLLGGKVGYVHVIGRVAYLEAGLSLYSLDPLQARITGRYALPCKDINTVIPWHETISVLCNSARSTSLLSLFH
jgi:hypothetical protein